LGGRGAAAGAGRRAGRTPEAPAMLSLAETQLWIRRAVVDGDTAGIPPQLIGGRNPRRRLAIHQRHYRSSLVAAIRTKFPATAWLLGMPCLGEAAEVVAHQSQRASP